MKPKLITTRDMIRNKLQTIPTAPSDFIKAKLTIGDNEME